MAILSHLASTVQADLNHLFTGELLGHGSFREVYECRHDTSLVIKIENTDTKRFCNIHEWMIWEEVADIPRLAKWFAPCITISPNGAILVQKRTDPLPHDFKLPSRIPNFLADVKRQNWGLLEGRAVMHDYGNHNVFTVGLSRYKLVSYKSLAPTT